VKPSAPFRGVCKKPQVPIRRNPDSCPDSIGTPQQGTNQGEPRVPTPAPLIGASRWPKKPGPKKPGLITAFLILAVVILIIKSLLIAMSHPTPTHSPVGLSSQSALSISPSFPNFSSCASADQRKFAFNIRNTSDTVISFTITSSSPYLYSPLVVDQKKGGFYAGKCTKEHEQPNSGQRYSDNRRFSNLGSGINFCKPDQSICAANTTDRV